MYCEETSWSVYFSGSKFHIIWHSKRSTTRTRKSWNVLKFANLTYKQSTKCQHFASKFFVNLTKDFANITAPFHMGIETQIPVFNDVKLLKHCIQSLCRVTQAMHAQMSEQQRKILSNQFLHSLSSLLSNQSFSSPELAQSSLGFCRNPLMGAVSFLAGERNFCICSGTISVRIAFCILWGISHYHPWRTLVVPRLP